MRKSALRPLWTAGWVAWIVAFFVVEMPAVFNGGDGDTLSEHVRAWFQVDTFWGRVVFLAAWVGFACWFAVHIVWQRHKSRSGAGRA